MQMASKRPSTHRHRVESQMIRRREKQFNHDQLWGAQKQYYEQWDTVNSKYENWTSPRYYDNHGKYVQNYMKERQHQDNLINRREKLRKLLMDEDSFLQVELMMHRTDLMKFRLEEEKNEVPVNILKEINDDLVSDERNRRKHLAENGLYRHWRTNNPVLREEERQKDRKNLKLSWLDQQIEKRMQKEKEEEECRKILREREELLREAKKRDEEEKIKLETKREELKRGLDEQMEELQKKIELSERLQREEKEENKKKLDLFRIEEKIKSEEERKKNRELAQFNIRHHKLRLREKAAAIREDLNNQRQLIDELKELEAIKKMEDEAKRTEIRDGLNEFRDLIREQKKLEERRLKILDSLFESEMRPFFEQQMEVWGREELARRNLLSDVLETVKVQVEEKMSRNKKRQIEVVEEREEMLRKMREYDEEMEELKRAEEKRKSERARDLNEGVKVKTARKKVEANKELRKIQEDLENARKEEERLKREILKIQKKTATSIGRRFSNLQIV